MSATERHPVRVEAPDDAPRVRRATGDDVDAIVGLLEIGARRRTTIARRAADVRAHLSGFRVADEAGVIQACGAVEPVVPGLGEIRSVAVSEGVAGRGFGRALVEALIEQATHDGLLRVVLLTRVPGFFARSGFLAAPIDHLPHAYVQAILLDRERSFEGKTAMLLSIASAPIEPPIEAQGRG
ncbi:MAG: GNAT family N-acetyltransferase [Planctomycetota bacterium]